jgi:hypothetical protein
MRRSRKLLVPMLSTLAFAFASSATAATLELQKEWVNDPTQLDKCGWADYSPTGCYGWWEHYAVYSAGAEPNNVTVSGEGAEAIVLRDPNVPIAGGGSDGDIVGDPTGYPDYLLDGTVPISRSWTCMAPTSRGNGLCFGTPSDNGFALFDRTMLSLGDGDDTVNLTYGSVAATVALGSGNDLLHARNGLMDHIDCGSGDDGVWADSGDTVDSTCEAVTR